jgi:tetratricopeptide (TPR) repeat protein
MNPSDLIQTALSRYQSGCFQETIDLCREILNEKPGHFKALHLLGLSGQSRREYDLSISCFEEMIRLYPEKALGYFSLANVYYELRKLDQAAEKYHQAAQRDSADDHIFNNWGIVLREKGSFEEAVSCFQKAIHLNPDNANAYHNLGNTLDDLGKVEGSIRCYQKALQINPSNVIHYKCLGNALRETGQLDESLEILSQALDRFPDDPEAYFNLGAALKAKGRLDEAVECYRKAIDLNPYLPQAFYNLGNVFKEKGQIEEAVEQFQKALELDPNFAETYNNLGMIYKETGELGKALLMFQKAWEVKPGFAEAKWNMGLACLLGGNFLEGWEGYEWRWEKGDYKKYKRPFSKPLWNGEDISRKTILLHAEQGYGDTLQFIRYVPLVAERSGRVWVECPRDLVNLLGDLVGGKQVITRGDPLPEFDFHCPLMTLPKVFGTTLDSIPSKNPYLKADPDLKRSWQERINSDPLNFKIGLVWSGNPEHLNDRNRSCSFETLSPLFQIQKVQIFSLQKGEGSEEAKHCAGNWGLVDFTDRIHNFSDTAALIENLDLVISVDTAVAHLAGALGKRVWLLLPFSPDWRWLLGRDDSPWYPTMGLYRQTEPGNWREVIQRVVADLKPSVIG